MSIATFEIVTKEIEAGINNKNRIPFLLQQLKTISKT